MAALAAPQTASAAITEYSAGLSAASAPRNIVAGPDGNLWFTEGKGSIGRIDPSTGGITEFPTVTPLKQPADIAAGPDGNLWFTEQAGDGAIGRITPTGQVTEFITGLTKMNKPAGITAGPDGNLWFTEQGLWGRIGRITPAGAITEFPITDFKSKPTDIAAGGDGNLWFTENADPGRIGRISPTGTITEFSAGLTPNSAPNQITAASDGRLYFTQADGIGRVRTDGKIEEYTDGLTASAQPAGIAEGADGALWFAAGADPGRLGRVDPEQDTGSELLGGLAPGLSANAAPAGVTRGPDGNVWFTESADPARIGRITVSPGTGDDPGEVVPPVTPVTPATPATPTDATPGEDSTGVLAPTGPPVLGEALTVRPVSGSVFVKAPGARRYVALGAGGNIRVGSLVDARRGHVNLQSARDSHGRTQQGTFWGSIFQVRQRRDGRGVTDLVLRGGGFGRCGARAGASALARETSGRRRAIRRLWGKDRHARFRTHGRDSVATVRGTEWVTTDRCDGTLTKVREGKVLVRELHRGRSVLLTAGHAYLARHSRH